MEENEFTQPPAAPQRPRFLTVLCILTFISAGLSIMGSLLIPLMSDLLVEFYKQTPEYQSPGGADAILVFQAGWKYYLATLLLSLLSLTGALFMWNLKKNGFHFYTIANILLFYLPIIWLGLPFNLLALFLPATFIAMYALHLKFMN